MAAGAVDLHGRGLNHGGHNAEAGDQRSGNAGAHRNHALQRPVEAQAKLRRDDLLDLHAFRQTNGVGTDWMSLSPTLALERSIQRMHVRLHQVAQDAGRPADADLRLGHGSGAEAAGAPGDVVSGTRLG